MPNDKPLEQDREGKTVRCKPVERNQLLLRPVDVEKLVGEEHAVRAIWELVGKLDFGAFLCRGWRVGRRSGPTGVGSQGADEFVDLCL